MKFAIETITPSKAQQWLASSLGNRKISQSAVLEYAVSMESGKWSATASRISFDEEDRLIDGHHRLCAVILFNKSVDMMVHRGVPRSDRELMDTGRMRSLNDLTAMYTKRTNVNAYNAALHMCIKLLVVGQFKMPRIHTLDMAAKWTKLFQEGLEYCIEECGKVFDSAEGHRHLRVFRYSYISGAFAFAYRRNPNAIKGFLKRCINGEEIKSTEPVYTVRNLILGTSGNQAGGGGVPPVTVKILSGLYASIKGESYKTAQAGREGWEYFREAYDTAQVENILAPYLKFTVEHDKAVAELAAKARKP